MGLKMDDLHAPTVPSGPSSGAAPSIDTGRKTLFELMNERDRLESELSALGSVLTSHGVNMQTSLLTFDGYPRSDIDVAQIRTTRARIIRLKNDYKWLMDKIERGLHEHHAALAEQPSGAAQERATGSQGASMRTSAIGRPPVAPVAIEPPFARVNSVARTSPAEEAGLQVGDKVTKFGYVDWTNHDKLARIAQVVQANEGHEIHIKVLREDGSPTSQMLDIRLTPRHNWGGRGMLGCHLLPL